MARRLTALLLCLVLAITSLPLPALAQATEETLPPPETAAVTEETIPAETEETVPETVAETVPDTTEPEVTEESVPETAEPEVTEESVPEITGPEIVRSMVAEAVQPLAASGGRLTGTCGDNATWVLEDGVLTISGTGAINDYYIDNGPVWCSYSYNPSSQAVVDTVIIEPGITEIGEYSFFGATMESLSIPDTVTDIYAGAFGNCRNLSLLVLPEGVRHIGYMAFTGSGLKEIVIPGSMEKISSAAFSDTLSWVYYPGGQSQWNSINIYNSGGTINRINTVNKRLHYGERTTIGMGFIGTYENFYCFMGDPNIYNSDWADRPYYYHTLNSRYFYLEHGLTAGDITWTSSSESIIKIIPTGNNVPNFLGVTPGTARITATKPDGESIRFDVEVINPVGLSLGATYDTNQYYHGGSFYSALSSLSDSVEFYLTYEDCLAKTYPCKLSEDSGMVFPPFTGVTVKATIDSDDLSFLDGAAATTYVDYYAEVPYGKKMTDMLCLYPTDPETYAVPPSGKAYTLTLEMTCDNLEEPVTLTHSFTVMDAQTYQVDMHLEFADHNNDYKVSKNNAFGKNMEGLRNDSEYLWSKWSSLDFKNYSEVVLADMLIGMLDVPQGDISMVPKVLKDWKKTYGTIKRAVLDIVQEDYGEIFDISETRIDKILKGSKYLADDETFAQSELFQTVQKVFGEEASVSKVRTVFQKIDETGQVFKLVNLVKNPAKELVAWGNTLGVLNAFGQADAELKAVFRTLADTIPASEHDMKEAVMDYVNFSHDFGGKVQEIFDTFLESAGKMTLSSFDSVYGKKLWDYGAVKAIEWIGTRKLSNGALVNTTSAYKTLTSATTKAIAGSVLQGVSIGLSLSDLICSSSSKASEMGKLIAMSAYSPYVIQVLQSYENNLRNTRTMESVAAFERAFQLHQATQSYIMDKTVRVLQVKGESILFKIRGNDDYLKLASETLVYQNRIDALRCCTPLSEAGIQNTYHMAAIQCPVDVIVLDSQRREVLRILNDQVTNNPNDMTVFIRDGGKFIVLPGDQEYGIRLRATASGTMQYDVLELNRDLVCVRKVEQCGIPLAASKQFSGGITREIDVPYGSYALTSGSELYVPHDPLVVTGRENLHMLRLYNPNNGEHFYTGSTVERDNLVAIGWQFEGVGFTFPMNAGEPVYRLFDPANDDHLYTMNQKEVDSLLAKGWNYEGIAFNSATNYEVPQYRLHNPNARSGAWHFTGSEEERDMLISLGWEYQGIGWYSCWG